MSILVDMVRTIAAAALIYVSLSGNAGSAVAVSLVVIVIAGFVIRHALWTHKGVRRGAA